MDKRKRRAAMMMSAAKVAAVPWYLFGGIAQANLKAFYHPLGAASLAASYSNLIDPGVNNAVPGAGGAAPTFDTSYGWVTDGISQFLKCPIAPGDAITIILRYSNLTLANNKYFFGGVDGQNVGAYFNNFNVTGDRRFFVHGGNKSVTAPPTPVSGIIALSGYQGYFNGAALGAAITPGAGAYCPAVGISCLLNGAAMTPGSFSAMRIQGYLQYNINLTPEQMLGVCTGLAASTNPS